METTTIKNVKYNVLRSKSKDVRHLILQEANTGRPQHMMLISEFENREKDPPKKAKGEAWKLVDERGCTYKTGLNWKPCKDEQTLLEKQPQHKSTKFKIV